MENITKTTLGVIAGGIIGVGATVGITSVDSQTVEKIDVGGDIGTERIIVKELPEEPQVIFDKSVNEINERIAEIDKTITQLQEEKTQLQSYLLEANK